MSTPTEVRIRRAFLFGGALLLGLLAGCIADSAEETALPWATNQGWEGMAPIAPAVMDRYD